MTSDQAAQIIKLLGEIASSFGFLNLLVVLMLVFKDMSSK